MQRFPLRSIVLDLSIASGTGLIAYGAWLTFAPAGFIVGGMLLLSLGLRGIRR